MTTTEDKRVKKYKVENFDQEQIQTVSGCFFRQFVNIVD